MAVGSRVLRNLQTRRPGSAHRFRFARHHRWLHAALLTMSGEGILGSRRHRLRSLRSRAVLGSAAPDVYVYFGQFAPVADRAWRRATEVAALDSASISSLAQSACRFCAWRRASDSLCGWSRLRGCSWPNGLAAGASNPAPDRRAAFNLPGAGPSESERLRALSLSIGYAALPWDAIAH